MIDEWLWRIIYWMFAAPLGLIMALAMLVVFLIGAILYFWQRQFDFPNSCPLGCPHSDG